MSLPGPECKKGKDWPLLTPLLDVGQGLAGFWFSGTGALCVLLLKDI